MPSSSSGRPPPSAESLCSSLAAGLQAQPGDPLLTLIGAFHEDTRSGKIDLGVGVYRDEAGLTPVMKAVKSAEAVLARDQSTKTYLGPEGSRAFVERLRPIVFGSDRFKDRLTGLQTPGGTGALRLALELIAIASPKARVLIGRPTWPNHVPIIAAARLPVIGHPHFNVSEQRLTFDRTLEALATARPGDVALLQGCCHNPTGTDFSEEQWHQLARTMANRGVLPLIDLAYQGLGEGFDEDAAGMRTVLEACGEGLVAYSCDKNFGLYRERVGALYSLSPSGPASRIVQSNLLALARANWSMPPDHGAAVVATILASPAMEDDWRSELAKARERIRAMRGLLADAAPELSALRSQLGFFSTLSLTSSQVARLRDEHAIYLPASGRINLAGLTPRTVPILVEALASLR